MYVTEPKTRQYREFIIKQTDNGWLVEYRVDLLFEDRVVHFPTRAQANTWIIERLTEANKALVEAP